MNRIASVFLLILIALVSANQSAAEVYKYKDEKGVWHFTDDPRKARKLSPPPPPPPIRHKSSRRPAMPDSSVHGESQSRFLKDLEKSFKKEGEFQELGDAMAKGLEKGMEKLGEELGKAFEGFGELMILAEENKPDTEKKTFANKEEEIKHDIQQVLLGMFMVCQFQFIIGKSETCSKDGLKKKSADGWKVNEDSEMKKKFEDYDFYIDPKKNTRNNLLITAKHKNSGTTWEITHKGKKSLKESKNKISEKTQI